MLSRFLELNKKISVAFDKNILPDDYYVFGTGYFDQYLVPENLAPDITILDVGGGKQPNITADIKERLKLRIIGIDIDEAELKAAPDGLYDRIIITDITQKQELNVSADLIITRALLEHVKDSKAALQAMYRLLKPGGKIILFAPCRNAMFARLNMIIPEIWKLKLLDICWPEKAHELGFKAYYNRCTPREFRKMLHEIGFEIKDERLYYASRYFQIFFPIHLIWRGYQILIRSCGARNLCEGFTYIAIKPQ